MKYEEQFFSTYEKAVSGIDADFEISDAVNVPDGEEYPDSGKEEITLTLSASGLCLATQYSSYGDVHHVSRVTMNSGREGIAKLMFRYDIPVVRNDEEIDGEAMLESLFDALSHVTAVELIQVFLDLSISFTYET